MKIDKIIRFFLMVFMLIPLSGISQNFEWSNGKKAAIVLSYDDGLDSQLNYVIPQLDAFGFKGTFFLYGFLEEDKFVDWKTVSDNGHEIGNHSLFHPCKNKSTGSNKFSSENYDVPSILREVEMMNRFAFAITGKRPVSYAYPCGETVVGGVDYSDSLKQSGMIKYARNGRAPEGISSIDSLDFFKVPAFAPKPKSNAQVLVDYVETIINNGGLGILLFHGVGGDYLEIDADVHQELLNCLAQHKDEIWVTTFGEAMEYIQEKKNK